MALSRHTEAVLCRAHISSDSTDWPPLVAHWRIGVWLFQVLDNDSPGRCHRAINAEQYSFRGAEMTLPHTHSTLFASVLAS